MRRGIVVVAVLATMIVTLPAYAGSPSMAVVDLKSGDQFRGTFSEGTITLRTPGGDTEIPVVEISHILFNNKYAGKRDSKGKPDNNETVYLLSGKILVGMISGETFTITADDSTSREINHVELMSLTFPELYHTRKNADYVMPAPAPAPPKKEEESLKTEALPKEKETEPDRRDDGDVNAATINIGPQTPPPPQAIRMESAPVLIPVIGGGKRPRTLPRSGK